MFHAEESYRSSFSLSVVAHRLTTMAKQKSPEEASEDEIVKDMVSDNQFVFIIFMPANFNMFYIAI